MKIKIMLASAILATLVASVEVKAQNNNERRSGITSLNVNSNEDEFGKGESEIQFTQDGHKYQLKMNGRVMEELTVDGVKIPKENFSKYEPVINNMLKHLEEDMKEAKKHRAEAEEHRKHAEADRQLAEKHRKEAEKHREEVEVHRKEAEEHRAVANKHREEAEVHRKEAARHREEAAKHREEAEVHRKQAEEHRKLMEEMIDEIIKEKIVASRDDLRSVELSADEFSVNGKKQSNDLHQKFKKKFLKGNGKLEFEYSNRGTRLSID